MKKSLAIIFLICSPVLSAAQTSSTPKLEAYFSAIIVKDINVSINWYTDILGFTVLNKVESTERGFAQSNLKREDILIELIELDRAVSPEKVIPNYTKKTRMIGLFKTGFLVSDFDTWMKHLKHKKANFYGNIVSDPSTGKKMTIILDPDGNRVQIFEK